MRLHGGTSTSTTAASSSGPPRPTCAPARTRCSAAVSPSPTTWPGAGLQPGPEDIDLGDDDATRRRRNVERTRSQQGSAFLRGVWVVAQCILAVAFGAGLFIAFDQLWKWNNIVALVLSVLVILGLVVGVRVVRKTEDIGSTLIAVAVGALVTLGPLALLSSH